MTKLGDILDSGDVSGLEEISTKDLKLLWQSNFHDIPLDGMLLYKNEKHWFSAIGDIIKSKVKYVVVPLSEEQKSKEEFWHSLFQKYVGMHTDYDENQMALGIVRPLEFHNQFYFAYNAAKEKNPELFDHKKYFGNDVIGYFFMRKKRKEKDSYFKNM